MSLQTKNTKNGATARIVSLFKLKLKKKYEALKNLTDRNRTCANFRGLLYQLSYSEGRFNAIDYDLYKISEKENYFTLFFFLCW